jgi:hypothetical protein
MDRYGRTAETRLSEDILVASKFLLSVAMRGGLPAIFVSCNEDSDLIKLIADLRASNAALEWQARSMGWRSWLLVVAFPLEGLVRRHLRLSK